VLRTPEFALKAARRARAVPDFVGVRQKRTGRVDGVLARFFCLRAMSWIYNRR
jgi:hypothetical protein